MLVYIFKSVLFVLNVHLQSWFNQKIIAWTPRVYEYSPWHRAWQWLKWRQWAEVSCWFVVVLTLYAFFSGRLENLYQNTSSSNAISDILVLIFYQHPFVTIFTLSRSWMQILGNIVMNFYERNYDFIFIHRVTMYTHSLFLYLKL